MRFVVADDSPILRKKHGQFLHALGHDVAAYAATGQEAVDACESTSPSAILLDINMPANPDDEVTGGIEALHRLHGRVPYIFMLTSQDASAVLAPLREFAYIIKKPICDAESLGVHLERILPKR